MTTGDEDNDADDKEKKGDIDYLAFLFLIPKLESTPILSSCF
jgi:hypothetical protein